MKKGRHRRYEEARNLKRGPELDIEALFTDLGGEPPTTATVADDSDDIESDPDDFADDYEVEFDDEERDDRGA